MSLPFRPAIARDYDAPFFLQLPMEPWELRSGGVGGSAVSAAGIPESYVIRTDRIAKVRLRVLEEELEDVLLELEAIRGASESFVFSFDQDDPATDYDVYLHSPVWPAEMTPTRDDGYRGLFRIELELRTVDGLGFLTPWMMDEVES